MTGVLALQEKRWVEASRLLEAALQYDLPGDVRWSIDSTLIQLAFKSDRPDERPAQVDDRIKAAARGALQRSLRYPVSAQVRRETTAQMSALGCHEPLRHVNRIKNSSPISQLRLEMFKSQGYPGRDRLEEPFNEFAPAETPLLIELCASWYASDALPLSEKLHIVEQLLTYIETTHRDLISPEMATTFERYFSLSLWQLRRIEHGNAAALAEATQQLIPPTANSQLLDQLLSRMQRLRPMN